MRVLSVVHHRNAAAGVFREPARVAGHELVEWIPHEGPPPAPEGLDAAIVFGAEAQVDQEEMLPWLRHEKELVRLLLERDVPMLGVCFGSQVLAEAAGAVVRPAERAEIGWNEVELTPEGLVDPVLGFLPERFEAFGYPVPSRGHARGPELVARQLADRPGGRRHRPRPRGHPRRERREDRRLERRGARNIGALSRRGGRSPSRAVRDDNQGLTPPDPR